MQHFPAEACTPFRNKQISNPEGKSGIGTLSEIAIWQKKSLDHQILEKH